MKHGIVSTYTNKGCRCEPCSGARREYKREYDLKKRYGLTLHAFQELRERQGENCAICDRRLEEVGDVDHNHRTGKIRGILCRTCNLGIGHARDSPTVLRSAIQYLTLIE